MLAPQHADGAIDFKHSTTSMQNNEMPLDLLAEKPGAGGAPRDGANLKDQVKTTEESDTLDCGRDKVWQVWDPVIVLGDSARDPGPASYSKTCLTTLNSEPLTPTPSR